MANSRKLTFSNSVINGKSKPSSKWYLKHKTGTPHLDVQCPFQHHTDTSKYMSEYRVTKMKKVHEVYSDEIKDAFTPDIHVHEPILASIADNYPSMDSHNFYIRSPIDREEFNFNYRLEGRERFVFNTYQFQCPISRS